MVEPRRARGNRLVPQQSFVRNPMGFEPRQFTEKKKIPLDIFQENLPQAPQQPTTPTSNGMEQKRINPMARLTSLVVPPGTAPSNRFDYMQGQGPLASMAVSPLQQFDEQQRQAGLMSTIAQIDALTRQSQSRPMNPMSPAAGVPDMQAISNARMAPMLARDAAMQQNTPTNGFVVGVNDPYRYNPMDPQMDARQRFNAAMATAGRPMDRTRGGRQFPAPATEMPLNREAAQGMLQDRLAGTTREAAMNPRGRQDFAVRQGGDIAGTNRLGALRSMAAQNPMDAGVQEALRTAEALNDTQRADRRAAVPALREKRMAAAEARRQDLTNRTFRRNVARGMNPMSPQAQALFPNQVAAMRKQTAPTAQNPMAAAFEPNAPNTIEAQQARDTVRNTVANTSPTVQNMGLTGASTPEDFVASFSSYDQDVSYEGLQDLFNMVKTFTPGEGQANPFPSAGPDVAGSDLLNQLWSMPQTTSPEALREWYTQYRAEVKSRRDAVEKKRAPAAPLSLNPMTWNQTPSNPTITPPPAPPSWAPNWNRGSGNRF